MTHWWDLRAEARYCDTNTSVGHAKTPQNLHEPCHRLYARAACLSVAHASNDQWTPMFEIRPQSHYLSCHPVIIPGLSSIFCEQEREADLVGFMVGNSTRRPHIQLYVSRVRLLTSAFPTSFQRIVKPTCTLLNDNQLFQGMLRHPSSRSKLQSIVDQGAKLANAHSQSLQTGLVVRTTKETLDNMCSAGYYSRVIFLCLPKDL